MLLSWPFVETRTPTAVGSNCGPICWLERVSNWKLDHVIVNHWSQLTSLNRICWWWLQNLLLNFECTTVYTFFFSIIHFYTNCAPFVHKYMRCFLWTVIAMFEQSNPSLGIPYSICKWTPQFCHMLKILNFLRLCMVYYVHSTHVCASDQYKKIPDYINLSFHIQSSGATTRSNLS